MQMPDGNPPDASSQVEGSQEVTIPETRCYGRVIDQDGRPIGGVTVNVAASGGEHYLLSTNADGIFGIEGLRGWHLEIKGLHKEGYMEPPKSLNHAFDTYYWDKLYAELKRVVCMVYEGDFYADVDPDEDEKAREKIRRRARRVPKKKRLRNQQRRPKKMRPLPSICLFIDLSLPNYHHQLDRDN